MLKGHLGTFENDTLAGNRNAHSSHLFIVWALTQNWSHRANTKKGEILQHWRSRLIGMKTLQSVNTEKNHMWIVCVCSVPERCGTSTSSDAALPYDYMCQWGSNGGVRRHLISSIFLQIKVSYNYSFVPDVPHVCLGWHVCFISPHSHPRVLFNPFCE